MHVDLRPSWPHDAAAAAANDDDDDVDDAGNDDARGILRASVCGGKMRGRIVTCFRECLFFLLVFVLVIDAFGNITIKTSTTTTVEEY